MSKTLNVKIEDEVSNKLEGYVKEEKDGTTVSHITRRALNLYIQMRDNGQLRVGIED